MKERTQQGGDRYGEAATGTAPEDRARGYSIRPQIWERIAAGHRAILDELKPTKKQIDHGLELHYSSYVADVQGNVSPTSPMTLQCDRTAAHLAQIKGSGDSGRLKEIHRKCRTFESAFDPQWIEESRALYAIAGVHLGLEDVAHPDENTFEQALEHVTRCNFVYDQRDNLIHVASVRDIERGRDENKPCSVWHLAGVGCYAEAEDPVRNLDLFFGLGVRMFQLTYIQDNTLCCSWLQGDDTGLTPTGRQVVQRLNELGGMVDLAHCGDRSAADIIEASREPVLVSHTGCRTVYDDASNEKYLSAILAQAYAQGVPRPAKTGSRNASDEIMKAVAAEGGIVAFCAIDYVLGPDPESFSTWFRHVEHAVNAVGIDHVAIGTDRTFFPTWKPGPLDWTNWPYWTVGLVCRGLSDEEIRKIIGLNYLRHVERALDKRPWGEFM